MSYIIKLQNTELEAINIMMKTQKDVKIYKRLVAVKMKHYSVSNHEIATILDVHLDTITDWLKLFIENGIQGLCELHLKNRKTSKLDKHIEELKQIVEEHTISTISEFQNYISNKFGFEIEHSWLSRYCKKNSIALIKKPG
jgi:transposase